MRKIPNLRWGMMTLVFLASVLNYLDRQTLSILAPTIQKDLHLSDPTYAGIVNLFLIAYTLSYLLSGRLTDSLGTRWSMALFVGWWSLANMLTGLARSAGSLGVCRFGLGLGEAGNYTVAPKVVSEWFPPRERGVAMGLATLGATLGATLAPVLVVGLANRYGWRAAFVATGALGLVWIIPWLCLYHTPARHPRLTETERALLADAAVVEASGNTDRETGSLAPTSCPNREINSDSGAEPDKSQAQPPPETNLWRAALVRRDVWALMLARLLTDPVWYFYQFWFAKYLNTQRHVPQNQLGVTWVVYLAADAGSLLGGLLSWRLIQKGAQPAAARLTVMLGCACLLPLSPLVAQAASVQACLGLAMLMTLAHLIWLINISALVVDRIPRRILGTAFGIVAAGSTLGGILMNTLVAQLVTKHSYQLWFNIMVFLHPLAWLILRAARLHKSPTL